MARKVGLAPRLILHAFFLFSDTEAGFTVFGELPIPHFVPMALKTRTYPLLIIHYHISFYLKGIFYSFYKDGKKQKIKSLKITGGVIQLLYNYVKLACKETLHVLITCTQQLNYSTVHGIVQHGGRVSPAIDFLN